MSSQNAAVAAKPDHRSIAYNLGAIALFVALAGLALAYGIDAMGRGSNAGANVPVSRTLGGTTLDIPSGWLREDAERDNGFAKQVELSVALPLGPKGEARHIDITLLPRSRVRPSASLLDGVYLHQFKAEQLSGPPGLIGKPLEARDGFENETVWYDALSSSPFVAKCIAPVTADQTGRCLRTIYLGPGIAAVYSFDEDVLGNWRRFDAELHPLLVKIGAL